jgi:putative ABC transport system permease protein
MSWLRGLLGRLVTGRDAADIRNDLHEMYRRDRANGHTALRASVAFVRRTLSSAWWARKGTNVIEASRPSSLTLRSVVTTARRLVRGHRGYVIGATATLAVAIGINLLVFTIVNALWLRPLPFADADRLVAIPSHAWVRLTSPRLRQFEAVAGQVAMQGDARHRPEIGMPGVSRSIETLAVTPEYFGFFGLPVRGRDFRPEDDRAGAEPVAIVSHRFWRTAFDGNPDVVGTVIDSTPVRLRVIGIAPAGFEGARRGERADLWIPRTLTSRVSSDPDAPIPPLMAYGRLRPGQTIADAIQQSSTDGMNDRDVFTVLPLASVYGTPESQTRVIREGTTFAVVGGLALLVLIGGCATLMALVLVHYERRRRELAVRLALGASPRHLAAELIVELGLVGSIGILGALIVAFWGVQALPSLSLPGGVDLRRLNLSFDTRVLAAALVMTFGSLAVAAWWPIRRCTRASLSGDLVSGPAPTASKSSQRLRQSLLALQVAATVVVLVAAGLFVRAVQHGFATAPGFAVDRTVFATIQVLPPSGGPKDFTARLEASAERTRRLVDALRALPAVEALSIGQPPVDPALAAWALSPARVTTDTGVHELSVGTLYGGPEFTSALGVPLLAGRALTRDDVSQTPARGLMTASLARRLWPDGDPLGRIISIAGGRGVGGRFVIVGLVADVAYGSLSAPAAGVVFGVNEGGPRFVFRTSTPHALVFEIRRTVAEVVPDARVEVITGREIVARDLGRQQLGAWFFSGFGVVALLLGVGGVFGLVAYLAEARQREYGVRLALGATPRALVRHAVSASLAPVACGTVAGLAGAGWLSAFVASLLVGLSALDPLTYLAAAGLMLAAAYASGLSAAWRLRRVAALDALRQE